MTAHWNKLTVISIQKKRRFPNEGRQAIYAFSRLASIEPEPCIIWPRLHGFGPCITLLILLIEFECRVSKVTAIFAQKSQMFYHDGIIVLAEKQQKIIDQNGAYKA